MNGEHTPNTCWDVEDGRRCTAAPRCAVHCDAGRIGLLPARADKASFNGNGAPPPTLVDAVGEPSRQLVAHGGRNLRLDVLPAARPVGRQGLLRDESGIRGPILDGRRFSSVVRPRPACWTTPERAFCVLAFGAKTKAL